MVTVKEPTQWELAQQSQPPGVAELLTNIKQENDLFKAPQPPTSRPQELSSPLPGTPASAVSANGSQPSPVPGSQQSPVPGASSAASDVYGQRSPLPGMHTTLPAAFTEQQHLVKSNSCIFNLVHVQCADLQICFVVYHTSYSQKPCGFRNIRVVYMYTHNMSNDTYWRSAKL